MEQFLDGLSIPTDPAVSPDGSRVAFVVTRTVLEDDEYRRAIWMADTEGARPFTGGDGDTAARWSPDGTTVAFLRKVDDHPQLALIPTDGGEARVVTEFPLGVGGEPVWSPDGSQIALVGGLWDQDWADLDEEERKRKPRHITRRDYRFDGLGWIHDRRRFVHLVDSSGEKEPVRLTDGTENEANPVWSPDGKTLVYLTGPSDRPGFDPGSTVALATSDGSPVDSPVPWGIWATAGFRPDGVLHAIGMPGIDFPDLPQLWRFDPDPVCVNSDHPRAVYTFTAGSTRLVFQGQTAVLSNIDSGSVGLIAVSPDGEVDESITGHVVVGGFDVVAGTLAATVSTIDHPGRLVVRRGDQETVVDDFGGATPEVIEPEHFVLEGPEADLDVWVYLPPGDDEVPLLLNIHGGPASQYGWGFFDEFQVYADAGYGVVATNPRGSGGRDREFLRAVRGEGWGTVDVADVDRAVAAALDRFTRLDPDRLGVMGGSYGGFLTAWLIAHQDRWKSAIVERALLSWPSFGGTSDIGGWFEDKYLGAPGLAWDKSPQRLADRISTPTLVIHSEQDLRCPIEQAEQFFDTLLRNGVHAEFLRFPGEGHELSRSGKPRHRQERFEAILEWLGRTLMSPAGS